ncbi:hypothetical protein ACAG39_01985 [Caldicellulosiruptoraceae bacterium PP1]
MSQIVKTIPFAIQIIVLAVAIYFIYSFIISFRIQTKIDKKDNEDKKTNIIKILLAIIGFILGSIIGYYWTGTYIGIAGGFGFGILMYKLPEEFKKNRLNKISYQLSSIVTLFEVGIKTNVPIEKIFEASGEMFKDEKIKMIFKRAGAIYLKTKDIEEAFYELEKEIPISDIKLLKNSLKEIDKMGTSGIIALETFSKMQAVKSAENLIKKKESVTSLVTVAIAVILFGAMFVYFFPIYNSIMENMSVFFGS